MNWQTVKFETSEKTLFGTMGLKRLATKRVGPEDYKTNLMIPIRLIREAKNPEETETTYNTFKENLGALMHSVVRNGFNADNGFGGTLSSTGGRQDLNLSLVVSICYDSIKTFRFANLDFDEDLNVIIKYDGFNVLVCNLVRDLVDEMAGNLWGNEKRTEFGEENAINKDLITRIMEKIKFMGVMSLARIRDLGNGETEICADFDGYVNAVENAVSECMEEEKEETMSVDSVVFKIMGDKISGKKGLVDLKAKLKNINVRIGRDFSYRMRIVEEMCGIIKQYLFLYSIYLRLEREIFGDIKAKGDFKNLVQPQGSLEVKEEDVDLDLMYEKIKTIPYIVDMKYNRVGDKSLVFCYNIRSKFSKEGLVRVEEDDYEKVLNKTEKIGSSEYRELVYAAMSMLDDDSKLKKEIEPELARNYNTASVEWVKKMQGMLEDRYRGELLFSSIKNNDSDLLINNGDDIETILKNVKYKYENSIKDYTPDFIDVIKQPVIDFKESGESTRKSGNLIFLNTGKLINKVLEGIVKNLE